MTRIVYGVSGEGSGHSSRARVVLEHLVREGHEVKVVDVKTEEDLTQEVLLQIVLEVLKGTDFFPTGMLRRIIRSSGDNPGEQLLRRQLVTGLEMLSAQLDRMEALIPKAPVAAPPPTAAPRPARSPRPR